MKYETPKDVPEDLNFCRVFELPVNLPTGFCFGGGIKTSFLMVDWFNPIPHSYITEVPETWDELQQSLTEFILQKRYALPRARFVVICNFGWSFMIEVNR